MATILVLNNFSNLDARERELLVLMESDEEKIIVDASELTIYPDDDEFENVLFFARIAHESAQRRGAQVSRIIVVMPRLNTAIAMERIKKLINKGGFDIEIAATLNDAKVAFNETSDWHVTQLKPLHETGDE